MQQVTVAARPMHFYERSVTVAHIQTGFSAPVLDAGKVIGFSSLILRAPTPQVDLLAPGAASLPLKMPHAVSGMHNTIPQGHLSVCTDLSRLSK